MSDPAPSDERPHTADGGSSVPEPTEPTGATPQTETGAAAEESLESAEDADDESDPAGSVADPEGDGIDSDSDGGAEDRGDEDGDDEAAEDEGPENTLDVEGEIAADYLEELLDIADLDGDIDTYVESDRAHVSIVTDAELLVGSQGEVLDALQELSRLAVMTETGHRSRLMLDVAGYRDKRRKVLVDLATDAVQEVRDSGESVRLAPMNPFERKIVHDTVAAAGLTSASEGEEPGRRVVVQPSA